MQRTVDIHSHFFPWDYLMHLTGRPGKVRAEQTGADSYIIYCGSVVAGHIDRRGHYDVAARMRDLDNAGLATQIMSKTLPGPELMEPDEGIYWASRINDALAEAVRDHPHRLYALASLPYQDVDAACRELERCIKDLGVKGIQMFSNVQGTPMHDPRFEAIFKMAAGNGLPILMHPTMPLTAPILDMMRMPYQLYGFTFDTTMAVISLIFHGVLARHPKLRIVHAHLGGMVPYLVRRLRDSWKGYSKEWGLELDEYPDETYRRQVYPDTTSFYVPAMKCCLEWVGPGHIMMGTDYAHRIGDPEGAIRSILGVGADLGLSQDDVGLMLGKTAERLFNLPPMPPA